MFTTLVKKSSKDSWLLLLGCTVMILLFCATLVWGVSQIKTEAWQRLILEFVPERMQQMFKIPIKFAATPAGRIASGYSHPFMVVMLGYWTIARSANAVSGKLSDGTMELLLAQPVSRMVVYNSQGLVTLVGCFIIGAAAWCGTAFGINNIELETPVASKTFLVAAANLIAVGIFLTGITTLLSSFDRSRSRTIGIMVGFCALEGILEIVARQADYLPWLRKLTFFSCYRPQRLVYTWLEKPSAFADLAFDCFAPLLILGLMGYAIGALIFQERDLPAPL